MTGDKIGHETAVTIGKDDNVAFGHCDRPVADARQTITFVFLPKMFDGNRRFLLHPGDGLGCFRAGSVIGDNDFEIVIFLINE